MGPTPLVEADINTGRAALKALDDAGVRVRSALWLFEPETGWKLVFALPMVDTQGSLAAYSRVRAVLDKSKVNLPLSSVTLLSTGEALPKSLRGAMKTGKKDISNIRFQQGRIGDRYIDDAIIYRSA